MSDGNDQSSLTISDDEVNVIDLSQFNRITRLNISNNENLKVLDNYYPESITHLSMCKESIPSIDLSVFPNLQELDISDNQDTTIDYYPRTLIQLIAHNSNNRSFPLFHCASLQVADFSESFNLQLALPYNLKELVLCYYDRPIDFAVFTHLELFSCQSVKKHSLTIQNGIFPLSIKWLNFTNNEINFIDIRYLTNLRELRLPYNYKVSLILSKSTDSDMMMRIGDDLVDVYEIFLECQEHELKYSRIMSKIAKRLAKIRRGALEIYRAKERFVKLRESLFEACE